jgi:hypothetical protein
MERIKHAGGLIAAGVVQCSDEWASTGGAACDRLISLQRYVRRHSMSLQSHLAELERKHRALESEIAETVASPSGDDARIAELKRKKLQLKDEMERLRKTLNGAATIH